MNAATVLDELRGAIEMALTLSAPMLLTVLAIGAVVGVVQAATQMNEPTIGFVAKAIALVAVLIAGGSWLLGSLVDYTVALYQRIPMLVG